MATAYFFRSADLVARASEPADAERYAQLAREKPRLALCAHDAHGLPGYEEVFQSLAMYLPPGEDGAAPELSGDARAAAEAVVKGLASGRALCAFRALGEPEGFVLEGVDAERREILERDLLSRPEDPMARYLRAKYPESWALARQERESP